MKRPAVGIRTELARLFVLGVIAIASCALAIVLNQCTRRIESEIEINEAEVDLFQHGARPVARSQAMEQFPAQLIVEALLGRLPSGRADFVIVTEDSFARGVSAIVRAPDVDVVVVMFSTIDRAKVNQLCQLRHLRTLRFGGCAISGDSLSELRARMPYCVIERMKERPISELSPQELSAYQAYVQSID